MIPKKARGGANTVGLLTYLFGPGRRDEHAAPHLVAAWNPFVDDPAVSAAMSIGDLALLLDAPVYALPERRPRKHVYHVAVRNDPADRLLSEEEWAQVAEEMMHVAGIAERGDEQGARLVAVRHADDHIHIVATLARQDGRQPNVRQDMVRMQAAARRLEVAFGLRRLVSGDRTARIWPTTGEREKASTRGLSEVPRETLQRVAREAASGARNEADFFARIEAAGVRVRQRVAPDGRTTGYAVALVGDRNAGNVAVWYSGGRLAPDLSLPRARERWTRPLHGSAAADPPTGWRVATEGVRVAARVLGGAGPSQGAGDVAALGDLIATASGAVPTLVREEVRAVAREFERAGRAPGARSLDGEARALYRSSAQALGSASASALTSAASAFPSVASSSAAGQNDAAAMLAFLLALVESVAAARRWHEGQRHQAQAEASERAGRLLSEAVEVTTGAAAHADSAGRRAQRRFASSRGIGGRGEGRSGRPGPEELLVPAVQTVLGEQAAGVLADAGWPALRARLVAVQQRGEDVGAVLAEVVGHRELVSADSIADVLAWRLEGWLRRASTVGGRAPKAVGTVAPARGTAAVQGAVAAAAARRPPGADRSRSPRRGL